MVTSADIHSLEVGHTLRISSLHPQQRPPAFYTRTKPSVHKQFWEEIAGEGAAIKWLGIFRLPMTFWSMLLLPASVVPTGTFVIIS